MPPSKDHRLDTTLRALADPTRRRILRQLRHGERAAGEIAHWFPTMSRPAVSQHLTLLERASLVAVRHEGNRRMYSARPEGLGDARRLIEELWQAPLGRLKAAAERAERQRAN